MAVHVPDPSRPVSDWVLRTFHATAENVPAYHKFLSDKGVVHQDIQTRVEFAQVPPVTKDNYLTAFDLAELMPDGDITAVGTWSTSSGSSGRPCFWGRGRRSHRQSTRLHGGILRSWDVAHHTTLLVNCFAQGDWIAGSYTFRAIAELSEGAFPLLSVVNPGIDVEAARRDIATIGRYYEQVVIAGYPPFVRDILDGAGAQVLDQHLLLLLAGENVTEDWRDGVLRMMGQPGRVDDVCVIYGTADAGMVGHETPTTIALRRRALGDPKLDADLFGGCAATATFVEFDSTMRHAETDSAGRLLFTVDNSMPLVRYRMNDEGSVFTPAMVAGIARRRGHDERVRTSSRRAGFIVLRGRSDDSVSFYAVKIYRQPIRQALSDPALSATATGLSVLVPTHDDLLRPTLELRVQLRAGVRVPESFADAVADRVIAALAASSSEYRKLRAEIGDRSTPRVTLHDYDSPYFRYEIKPAWKG